jgi:hypothetical protein
MTELERVTSGNFDLDFTKAHLEISETGTFLVVPVLGDMSATHKGPVRLFMRLTSENAALVMGDEG